jgi:plastocyanin
MKRFLGSIFVLSLGLALQGCGSSSSSPTGPTSVTAGGPAQVVVTIMGINGAMSFSPNPVSLKVGQTVAWQNADAIPHQPVQDSSNSGGGGYGGGYGGGGNGSSGFNAGMVNPGSTTVSIAFNSAGTVSYHCSIHPSMVGTISISQ